MWQKKLLFIGFGDIATRASRAMTAAGCAVAGVARSERQVPDGVDYWRGAVTDSVILQKLAQHAFDVAVITLTPAGRRESDYLRAYVNTSQQLVRLWRNRPSAPRLVIYVSSSSVYHQTDGSWVDEYSPTCPASPSAQCLLQAERLWLESGLNACVLRFSGIYGPGREHLIQQVKAGKGGPKDNSPYTNRIHVDDCVGVVRHLCERHWAGQQLEPVYLASDDTPAPGWEVRSWLAQQLGYSPDHLQESPASGRGGNKRCSNARLRATGYNFKHPDYRSGYEDMIG